MRVVCAACFKIIPQALQADVVAVGAESGAEIRPAQIQHKRIQHIALAIAVNRCKIARLRHVRAVTVPFPRQPQTKATASGIPIASECAGLDKRPINTVSHDLIAFGIGMNLVRAEFRLTQHRGKDLPDHQHPFLFP